MQKSTETLGSADLAAILGLSPYSLHSALSRRPERLPRPVRIPGARRLLWRRQDVEAWLAQYAQPAPAKRGRGRPTKVEQMQRSRTQTGGQP